MSFEVKEECEEFLKIFKTFKKKDLRIMKPKRFTRLFNQDMRFFKKHGACKDMIMNTIFGLDAFRMN